MSTSPVKARLEATGCEVCFDDLTRQLYATDASLYQIPPMAVAFPRTAEEAARVIGAAAESGVAVTPRGAGTGLVGGAIGSGIVVDLARHLRGIGPLDRERMTVRAGAGVVLDALNAWLKPHGLCFGPDVATSSRATIGGMIANNSSGARAPIYGLTADHVVALDAVLADGRTVTIDRESAALGAVRDAVGKIVARCEGEIRARMPEGLVKRWPGYAFDRWLKDPGNLLTMLVGSEGTLAGITGAELKVVPIPRKKVLVLLYFPTVLEAMSATVDLLDLKPAAIEHIDRILFDQTRGQLAFEPTRALMGLDDEATNAILMVEFYDNIDDRVDALLHRNLGTRHQVLTDAKEMERVWALRKAGVALLMGRKGAAKPIVGIEDTAVRPTQLPEYVRAFQELLKRFDLDGSFYGHAASGLLHIRPVLDLHTGDGVRRFRELTTEVSALVKEFNGSISAEHGVGIAQTPYLREHLGGTLVEATREVKALFDPKGRMNPGKLLAEPGFESTEHLRWGAGYAIPTPFEPVLRFAAKDGSFVGNLEQCNGCGGCRKETPTMCPTFIATGDEIMSTRGRANVIRAVLDGRLDSGKDPLLSPSLDKALGYCLACKACTAECPSNVNMALMKAELLHAKQRKFGVPLRERVFSLVDVLGALGTLTPGLANAALKWRWLRQLLRATLGIALQRPLPPYARQRFDRWFHGRARVDKAGRGKVYLWDDTFVRFHEPNVGQAAVTVLEAAGFEVALVEGRKCCGRPAFSVGRLDRARALGEHNVRLIRARGGDEPILFLEPSCYAMFAEDYRELGIDGAEEVAKRCLLFEQFVWDLVEREPDALHFDCACTRVAVHAHCHAKALSDTSVQTKLLSRIPDAVVTMLNTGCCGMAGAFGACEEKYDVSVKVAEPLVQQLNALEPGAAVVASGTSCRHQITHLTESEPLHIAELLARALARR